MDQLEPLALVQDGYLQRTRVGATSGLAAKCFTPEGVTEAGMIGTGWQAGAQALALKEALPGLKRISVYGRNKERRAEFCRTYSEQASIDLAPADSANEAIADKHLWVLATNALEPVVDGDWLTPDTHANSIQGREIDRKTLERADRVLVRMPIKPSHWAPAGFEPLEVRKLREKDTDISAKMMTLGSVIANGFQREPGWITVFGGGGTGGSAGLGVQFAAVANLVYQRAKEVGLGHEIDGKWFRQPYRP
ncbi:MAG: hypothetical protein M1358_07105 [Chloroflexi bacterium]|nr:hypothetical protein [Chloroflexota bacterium]